MEEGREQLKPCIIRLLQQADGRMLDYELAEKVDYSRNVFENAAKEFPQQRVSMCGGRSNKLIMLPEYAEVLTKVNYHDCKIAGQHEICYENCKEYCTHWITCEADLAVLMGKKASPDVMTRRIERFLKRGRPVFKGH